MADTPLYPLTQVRFEVDFGGSGSGKAMFAEVNGLNIETDMIEYRGGAEKTLTTRKLPGLMKYSNVTMKRGILAKDNDLFSWWTLNQQGKHKQRTVTVKLLNEAGTATVTWTMVRAWPVKVEGPSLNAKGNDVAIESIEFCHEGLTVKNS
ncbi:MAG: phage tail protein [Planctomycetota bacterium]